MSYEINASRFLVQNARVVVQKATAACLNEDYDRKMLASVVMGLMIMLNNTVEACEEEDTAKRLLTGEIV